ncbi:hypothetical protein MNV49_002208 [Pseudohyphozyma bogoriensis]|nr:hypothetical protein MNV49_002208 [Pseudohyphozyma bogoriensis]
MRARLRTITLWRAELVWLLAVTSVHGQVCSTGTLQTTPTGVECCQEITPLPNTGADSCVVGLDSTLNRIYTCTYSNPTTSTASLFAFPDGVQELNVEVAGAAGSVDPYNRHVGGLGQVVSGTLSTSAGFVGNLAYIFVDVGGGNANVGASGKCYGGNGGGFGSIGIDDTYATADSGTPDGRLVVGGGGGGAAVYGDGGGAGNPDGANGLCTKTTTDGIDGYGGSQLTGGAAQESYSSHPGVGAIGGDAVYVEMGEVEGVAAWLVPDGFTARSGESTGTSYVTVSYALTTCMDYDEITSCGGCVSDNTGVDCLALPGYDGVGCIDGKCHAFWCGPGYTLDRATHTCQPKLKRK